MKKIVLTAVIFTASSGTVVSASEALQIGYDFDAQNGNPTQTDSNASLSVVTLIGDSSSFVPGNPSSGFGAAIFAEGNPSILQFTVTPNVQLSLTNFSYDAFDFTSDNVEVRSSADSFTTILNSFNAPTSYATQSFSLSNFNNISNPVTFRIQQSSNTIGFDNVRLDFTPTPVPFEFSPTFGVAALAGIWVVRKLKTKI